MTKTEPRKGRKRKLSEKLSADEDETLIKSENAEENDGETTNHNNNDDKPEADNEMDVEPDEVDEEEEELHIAANKPFHMKHFREKLREGDFIVELRHFLQEAHKNPAIIGQYLKVGGKPLELIQTLERIDKTQLYHISYIFNALQLTLIEILTNAVQLTQPSVQAISFLLNSHRNCVEKLLNSNQHSHKKSVLKLLTAIVTLEPQFGRDILQTFSIVFNAETLGRFTQHKLQDVRNMFESSGEDQQSIRTCYIHFILAYLIEGKQMLIRNLLDRNELIMAVVSGLLYDRSETCYLVLGTLQKFVLKTAMVSKTKKVQIFNVPIVQHILNLLEWKGPAVYAAVFGQKNSKKVVKTDHLVNADELKVVADAASEFLTILLTSRKYGVAFQCLGFRRTKTNAIQKRILTLLTKPWLSAHRSELALQILRACPELTRSYLKTIAPTLDMKRAPAAGTWCAAAEWFCKFVDEMKPAVLRVGIDQMSAIETVQLMKAICFTPEILENIKNQKVFKNVDLNIRYASTKLFYAMFRQCNNYLVELKRWTRFSSYEMRKMKFDLINHIFNMCPPVEMILFSLHITLQVDISESISDNVLNHLEVVLDLLLIIATTVPSFIESTGPVINYINILQPIYEMNREHATCTRIELKAIKLILQLEPKALSVQTPFFLRVCNSFLNVYCFGTAIERNEAKGLLQNVLQNTGVFENGTLEIDLWLEAFRLCDLDDVELLDRVKLIFIDTIIKLDKNSSVSRNDKRLESSAAIDVKNVTELFFNIENGITLKGLIDIPIVGRFYRKFLERSESASDDTLEYLNNLSFYLFHFIPMPETVYESTKSLEDRKYSKYMKKWIKKGEAGKLKEFPLPLLAPFYNLLVNGDSIKAIEFFAATDTSKEKCRLTLAQGELELDGMLANETQLMIFIYVSVFLIENHATIDCVVVLDYLKVLLECLYKLAEQTETNGFEDDAKSENIFMKALKYIFCSRYSLLSGFNCWHSGLESTHTVLIKELILFLKQLAQGNVDKTSDILEIFQHFRTKLTNQIELNVTEYLSASTDATAAKNHQMTKYCRLFIELMQTLAMNAENCQQILGSLSKLSYAAFVTVSTNELSIFSEIFAFCLKRLAELKGHAVADDEIAKICHIYIECVDRVTVELNYELIEDALYAYLTTFYHQIGLVSEELFTISFRLRKLTKSSIRLTTLLLDRDEKLLSVLLRDYLMENLTRKELIYPLLNVIACKSTKLTDGLDLQPIYMEFKNGILKTIEKPQKAGVIYKENLASSLWLIERCMPQNECIDFTKKSLKFDVATAECYQLQMIKAIHLKAMNNSNVAIQNQAFLSFLNCSLQLMVILFRKDPSEDLEKINSFAVIIADWMRLIDRIPQLSVSISMDKVVQSANWQQFAKNCLKFGCQRADTSILLKLFAFLCDSLYADAVSSEDIDRFYEMALSHSEFMSIALNAATKNEQKINLMYLLHVLLKKSTNSIKSAHVPVFLAAYQAKLNSCDRFLLAILQQYELAGCSMHEFKPFLWGESAISHYSLQSDPDADLIKSATNLYQEPPMMQMMSLIDRDTIERTLENFPIWRKMNVVQQVPEMEFKWHGIVGNEHLDLPQLSRNPLEKCVNERRFREDLLLLNSRAESSYDDIYDPAFLIPLMSMAFAAEQFTRPVRPAQNGLLSLTFATLSAQDKSLRLAAGSALVRYRTHLEQTKFADSKVWSHLFEAVQRGLGDLTKEMRKVKKSRVPRVPFVAGLFLAKTINTLTQPLSEMYRPLSNYLLFQTSFNFLTVPEFNVLFNSSDVNHIQYRHFILEVIRDGLRCGSDFTILMSTNLFKALLGFYDSPMSTRDTNLLILTVVNCAVKIPKSCLVMVEQIGVLPWLSAILDNIEFFQFDIIDGVCNILNNLYYSVQYTRPDFPNAIDIEQRLVNLCTKLCPHLSTRTTPAALTKIVTIIAKLLPAAQDNWQSLSETNLEHLIKCVKSQLQHSICDFDVVRKTSAEYAESKFGYVKHLRMAETDEQLVAVDFYMREIIVAWLEKKNNVV